MRSPDMSEEEKSKYLDGFIDDYNSGTINFLSEERKALFTCWLELYQSYVKKTVKGRVKRII